MNSLVSIIIPNYNCSQFIEDSIRSAVEQTWNNKEIIVVDDGSTDNSIEIISASVYSDKIKLIKQENRGGSAARNSGLKIATGEYIQFLDADDLMDPDKIEMQMSYLRNYPNSVVHGMWARFENSIEEKNLLWEPEEFVRKNLTPIEWLGALQTSTCHSWLTPRHLIEEAGPWNEELNLNQDGEFFSRVVAVSNKVLFAPEAKVYYRSHRKGAITQNYTSTEAIYSNYETCRLFEELLLSLEVTERTKRICANRYLKFVYAYYPREIGLMKKVLQRVKQLGGGDVKPRQSFKFNFLSKFIGWKGSFRLRQILNDYRLNF